MGNSVSAARKKAEAQRKKIDQLLQALENKLSALELTIKATRGSEAEAAKTEVASGRTVMRVTEIRVADESGPDQELLNGINDFFNAVQSTIGDDNTGAKHSAVHGAKSLLSSGINALFGVKDGKAMEKQSFVVLFLNNAFVRVDYYIYSYSVSAKQWGAEANQAGMCYIADLAVLDMAQLKPAEVDFLVSQALQIRDGDFEKLMQIKISLMELAILSNTLQDKSLSFEKLSDITKQLGQAQKSISDTFKQMEDYMEPSNPTSSDADGVDEPEGGKSASNNKPDQQLNTKKMVKPPTLDSTWATTAV